MIAFTQLLSQISWHMLTSYWFPMVPNSCWRTVVGPVNRKVCLNEYILKLNENVRSLTGQLFGSLCCYDVTLLLASLCHRNLLL